MHRRKCYYSIITEKLFTFLQADNTYTMHINYKIYFIILSTIIFVFPSTTSAASGCCKVMKETGVYEISATETVYLTMDSVDCEKQKGPNSEVTFEEGKQASEDKNSCEDVSGTTEESKPSKPIPPQLQVSIPGFGKFSDVTCDDPTVLCEFPWIGEYIKAIYDYGLGVVGILSVIVMMIGGVIRLTAGGNHSQISQGNTYIKSSILGIIFTLCSYMILFIVNPNLTIFRPINVNYLQKIDLEVIDTISDIIDAPTDNLKYPNVKTYDPKKEKPSNISGCDDCVVTSIPTKNNKNINRDLNSKLLRVSSSIGWRITEAYPATVTHESRCHYNGRCVDIALFPPSRDCEKIREFIQAVQSVGLTVLNEYTGCKGTQTKYGSGGHLHVRE